MEDAGAPMLPLVSNTRTTSLGPVAAATYLQQIIHAQLCTRTHTQVGERPYRALCVGWIAAHGVVLSRIGIVVSVAVRELPHDVFLLDSWSV